MKKAEDKRYGDQIRKRRTELGWSRTDLSRKTGIPVGTISNFEYKGKIVKKEHLDILGKVLGITFNMTGIKTKVYMMVTQDKYSLPLAVADSAQELASMCGVKERTVFRRITAGKKMTRPKYIMVEIEEGEDECDEQ